jgi:hypothetical protein
MKIVESYNLLSKLALDNADYPVSSLHDSASFFFKTNDFFLYKTAATLKMASKAS